MPEYYDRCLGPALFAPYAVHLAKVAAAQAPESVLEIAAGTGILTVELMCALPASRIIATDLNVAMAAWAAQRVSGSTWLVTDAGRLALRNACFDLAVCQFGVMFFPDKPLAFAEVARVLRPGGRFLFTAWDSVDTSHFPAALAAALADVTPDDSPDFLIRIPHGYHDPGQIRRDLQAGGLVVESIERLVLRGSAPSARVVAEGFSYGTPLHFALRERGGIEALTEALAEHMSRQLGPGPVESDLAGYVVSARRP